MNKGRVFWITGLSGAGKTTVGRILYEDIKKKAVNTVFLDGDELRAVFGDDLGYTRQDRYHCSMRYARICQMLAVQDINVILCTISMFAAVREWNRNNIPGYFEVYLKVPIQVLKDRDQKGMYSGVRGGNFCNVAGMDLEAELPEHPDLVVENDGSYTPEQITDMILEKISL